MNLAVPLFFHIRLSRWLSALKTVCMFSILNNSWGFGEMAPWLRGLAAPAKDWSSNASTWHGSQLPGTLAPGEMLCPTHPSNLSWLPSSRRGHATACSPSTVLGHLGEPLAFILCYYLTLSASGPDRGWQEVLPLERTNLQPSPLQDSLCAGSGGVSRPSLDILAVQGQRAMRPLVEPQSVLCSVAEDPTFGWLLGCCPGDFLRERK